MVRTMAAVANGQDNGGGSEWSGQGGGNEWSGQGGGSEWSGQGGGNEWPRDGGSEWFGQGGHGNHNFPGFIKQTDKDVVVICIFNNDDRDKNENKPQTTSSKRLVKIAIRTTNTSGFLPPGSN